MGSVALTGESVLEHPRAEELTQHLAALSGGDPAASERVLELVYDELRRLAQAQMARERAEHTLQPTALVHEAYLRLMGGQEVRWESRAHFFGIAARAMRQILIDHARRRAAEKRGAGGQRVSLSDDLTPGAEERDFDLLDVHTALEKLAKMDPELTRMVELRFFGGLTLDETAEVMGLSRRKVAKDWAFARGWLARELSEGA